MRIVRALLLAAALAGLGTTPARAGAFEPLDQAVCRLIDGAARAQGLPVAYLARVIWRESSFRAGAVSPAGAEGIAQFMPGTASARGLADPFDPEQAIPQAARLLADLQRRFGNLGLVAAGYNAGAARVEQWLAGRGGLPAETRAYVAAVTDAAAEAWRGAALPVLAEQTCLAAVGELRRSGGASDFAGIWAPWGVQLAGNFSKPLALAAFNRAAARYARVVGAAQPMVIGRLLRSRGTRRFYQIRLPAGSRDEAQRLCGRIQSIGGACMPIRS